MRRGNRLEIMGPGFAKEFNKNRVSEEFLSSCKKAGRLFKSHCSKTDSFERCSKEPAKPVI